MLSAFFVNSLADSHDSNPGDGIAADANGFATLRAAVEEANAHLGADTITLPPGVFVLAAANGPLNVTDDVTILGSRVSEIDGTAFQWPGLFAAYRVSGRLPGPRTISGASTRPRDLLTPILPPAADPAKVPSVLPADPELP